jgi:hypothetical protein
MRALVYQPFGRPIGMPVMQGNNGGANPGQSNSYQTQSTSSSGTNTSAPSPFIQPFLQQGENDLANYYTLNPTAPGYYPNSTIAPPSQATQNAQGALYARGANGSALQTQGNNFAASVLNPNYLDVGNDPNFQASLAAGFQPQNQQFANVMVPGLRAQFESSGRNLGGNDGGTVDQALLGLTQGQANASAQAVEQAYQARMQNQFNVLNNWIPTSQNMDYQNIGAMAQAGANTDAANQAAINAAKARYDYNAMAQPNYISDYLQRILAGYPGGTTSGSGSGTSTGSGYSTFMPPNNPTASGIGAGLAGAGTIAQILPFLGGGGGGMFSDERLKEDIRPVGKLRDGQNVYAYRYKGDPRTQIGLLAQDVERVHPEAVTTHPSGYKMVDYGRATAPAGGLM